MGRRIFNNIHAWRIFATRGKQSRNPFTYESLFVRLLSNWINADESRCCLARLANHHKNPKKRNAAYKAIASQNNAKLTLIGIITTKNMEINEEIFVDYGQHH